MTVVRLESINDIFFSTIDTEIKAYLLGTIAGDLQTYKSLDKVIILVRRILSDHLPPHYDSDVLMINSRLVCNHLGLDPDYRSWGANFQKDVRFPKDLTTGLEWTFIRGLFDSRVGMIMYSPGKTRECLITLPPHMKDSVIKIIDGIKSYVNATDVGFVGTNSIDFLSKIYDHSNPELRDEKKYSLYLAQLGYTPINRGGLFSRPPSCRFVRTRLDAVAPTKCRASDEGMDLVIVAVDKVISEVTTRYDTGIRVQPEQGWHVELLPRSSLSNSGYMLANSVGLIDESYSGNLLIALTKVNPNAPPIQLPFKCIQMILRRSIHFTCEEVEELEETSRADGGFGSTNP